jgi:large subunit ribosomal protein L18
MKRNLGTKRIDRLRISIFRSNKYIYAQIIDDARGLTLISASDFSLKASDRKNNTKDKDGQESRKLTIARKVGKDLASKAKAKKISNVWFDRRAYKYHGRIKALAEGARSGGLQF